MEMLKTSDYKFLTTYRFGVTLPAKIDIPEILINKVKVITGLNLIDVEVVETKEKNIRDTFINYDEVNALIDRDDFIIIEYYDAEGKVALKEKYSNIRFYGEQYGESNYEENRPLTTTLEFRYGRRENVTAN